MRRTRLLRVMIGVLAFITLTTVLASGAWAQVTFKTLHNFTGKDGASPSGPLIFDAAGNLYGTSGGGEPGCYGTGCGTAYQLSPNADETWTLNVMHYFTPDEDFWPSSGVALDAAGNLYGMTDQGSDDGDVYELTPQAGGGWSETVLYKFAGAYDGNPQGGMTVDASGNLYGTSAWGCGSGWGLACVFEMTPIGGGWTFKQLIQFPFEGSTGWYPSSTTPVFDAKGNLYATTAFGGNSGCSPYGNGCCGLGVVFELSPYGDGTWSIKDLHRFTGGKDGESPTCPLALDAAGNFTGPRMQVALMDSVTYSGCRPMLTEPGRCAFSTTSPAAKMGVGPCGA